MPGKTPYQAFQAFVGPLERAMSCIARVKFACSEGGKSVLDAEHSLFLTGDPRAFVRLKGGNHIELRARMRYTIIRPEQLELGPFRVTTLAYDYALRGIHSGQVLDYHWHPSGASHEREPHLHIGGSQLAAGAILDSHQHIYTGRVTFELVVRTAVQAGAVPLVADWDQRLLETEGPHKLYRTWS